VKVASSSGRDEQHQSTEIDAIQLPESSISDEDLHAIAALLRDDMAIRQLNLRGNMISDDGAHALASILAGKSNIFHIDLRGNKVTNHGVRMIAEALERSERVRHVYVHAAGKVEALGVTQTSATSNVATALDISANVETVCCVDCRDNAADRQRQDDLIDGTPSSLRNYRPVIEAKQHKSTSEPRAVVPTKISSFPNMKLEKKRRQR